MAEECIVVKGGKERLDIYIHNAFSTLTRSHIQKLISEGHVTVNGKSEKAGCKVSEGDCIEVEVPEAKSLEAAPENIPVNILYEDEHIIFVDKPKGMVVHPAAGNYSGTLVNALLYHCKGRLSEINGVLRPGIVHRIDKDTSGVLVVAKTDKAYEGLAKLFQEHDIKRIYYALVEGVIQEETGTVDAPIGRHMNDRIKMAVNVKNGKPAVTHFRVLARSEKRSFLEVKLETGRTHQIRVHMAYISHPLVGDAVYGHKSARKKISAEGGNTKSNAIVMQAQGQILHAALLGFVHPVTKEYIEMNSPLPEYFIEKLKEEGMDGIRIEGITLGKAE